MTNLKLTGQQIQQTAKTAGVDIRTMVRFLAGEGIRKMAGERICAALKAAGLMVVLLFAACESSSNAPVTEGTGPAAKRGAELGTATAGSRPDAGTSPDALVLADTRPADTLAPASPDTMPAQLPDALVAVDTVPAVVPDALGLQADTMPAKVLPKISKDICSYKLGDGTFDITAKPGTKCGTYPMSSGPVGDLSCQVGCTVDLVNVGTFAKKPTGTADPPIYGTTGYCVSSTADTRDSVGWVLCFERAEDCAKTCL